MTEKLIIAGAGGQGVMLMGKILAEAAMHQYKYVTWFPAYGAEVRGGTAYCMVVISDEEIGSVFVDTADTLIIMNNPSFQKFESKLKDNGLIVVNESLVDVKGKNNRYELLLGKFSDLAVELSNPKVANVIALGFYIGKKKILKEKLILDTIDSMAPKGRKDLADINKQAFLKAIELVKSKGD